MIKGFDENNIESPVRAHISISFEKVLDREQKLKRIVEDLSKHFNPTQSTALIFVPTRKGTEEASRTLNEMFQENNLGQLHNKIDFFHAGLESADREEKYINFKQGKLLILVATKAFGMGMDIKNIHYVYHLGPSSTFEDYLQEVGRAGRNAEMLARAGFSKDKPIQTRCLYTPQDFNNLRDKLHKNQITWTHLNQVRETVLDYIQQFRALKDNVQQSFPLPLDLLDYTPEFKDRIGRDTFLRICLYWLEKLGRFKLGVYTPTHLPITIFEDGFTFRHVTSTVEKDALIALHRNLQKVRNDNFPEGNSIMIGISELREQAQVTSNTDLFKILFKAQKSRLIRVEREILMEPTKLRMPELTHGLNHGKYPLINAAFSFTEAILHHTIPGSQRRFEPDELDNLLQPIVYDKFIPQNFNWQEKKNSNGTENYSPEELTTRTKDDFIKKRAKFAFRILSFIPKIKHKSIVTFDKEYDKPITTQLLFNGLQPNEVPDKFLLEFKKDLISLIQFIAKRYIQKQQASYNIIDLINELDISEKGDEYLQNLLFIGKGLGYFKGEGSLIPMGIELFIKDISPFHDEIKQSPDYLIREEFIDTAKMKELRLLALECLSERPGSQQEDFIKHFFGCGTVQDLVQLLEGHFSENNPVLSAFREEALEKAVASLNPQQLEVYQTKINKNLQVIAGPGSGKTHTLILRVARLIQEEKVNPETILILAYNRAVVIELKERLGRLFKDLGYSKLISRLKVFTFHGFAKYCLGPQINQLDFENWTPQFIRTMKESPGLVNQKLGTIKYVFVDEFQDITPERLELLRFIANPLIAKICVIGDPNQSIYGYQRDHAGQPMDPKPYYDHFKEIYKPTELNLYVNYRSFPKILEEAEKLLALNASRYAMPKLEAFFQPETQEDYCEVVNLAGTRTDWKSKVVEFVNYRDITGRPLRQIAVLFRSNDEVYRAYNLLKREQIANVKIRIQGSKGSLLKTREFYHALSGFLNQANQVIDRHYISDFEKLKRKFIEQNQNWEEYYLDIFHCLLLEFDKESHDQPTYGDLLEFIREISHKDDGQFGKIYNQNIARIKSDYNQQEIVVTTMHKVKGIEYDAVIIPASLSNLPGTAVPENKIQDYIDEERRLYYVAYTRAKKKLLVIQHLREIQLEKGQPFQFPENTILNSYGFKIDEGIDKFTMYWSASPYGINSFEYIRDNVKIGDEIHLERRTEGNFKFWYVIHRNQKIAQASQAMVNRLQDIERLTGLVISSVYVSTLEETIISDGLNSTRFADRWTTQSKERGYTYLIDFSGYANIIS